MSNKRIWKNDGGEWLWNVLTSLTSLAIKVPKIELTENDNKVSFGWKWN